MIAAEKKYTTILVLITALLLFFVFYKSTWLLYSALFLGAGSLIFPAFAKFFHILWMSLSEILSKISNTLLLSAIFFLIVVPVSFLAKLFGSKAKESQESAFVARNHSYTKADLKNPW